MKLEILSCSGVIYLEFIIIRPAPVIEFIPSTTYMQFCRNPRATWPSTRWKTLPPELYQIW